MDEEEDGAGAEESGQPRSFMRLNDLSGAGGRPGPGSAEKDPGSADSEAEGLPYPALAPVVFFYLSQDSRPRSWCLRTVCNPWFERISMLVILLNCVTLGMFRPCEDIACDSQRCRILQAFDDFIFAFFAVEMVVKMVALGIFGKKCYLGDTWNRLDFFIVIAGMLEYSLDLQNVSFSAVRTVRVLRPLRAINRVPSMRILVTLLLDTLPMLGNVLLLCFFVFFIFGIVGVQLWAGLLRNRCFLPENFSLPLSVDLERYYQTENEDENPFICSQPRENGMRSCRSVPTLRGDGGGGPPCGLDYEAYNSSSNTTCVNWNQYYTNCSAGEHNPFKGAINFDNIGYAWIAIFQVITLEGWVDIMYFVMDAHSFYNFIYFILLIIVGSFFMINLCLVVIATQFSETKQRESQLMREQRVRFLSNASTLASFSEPGSCYEELLKYLVYILRKAARRLAQVSRAAGVRAGLLSSPAPRGSQEPQPSGSCSRSHRRPSVHHLVHHHHHHHHHYHLGNGTLRVPRASPQIQDKDANGSRRLMLPPPSTLALSGGPPGGAESVHSFYHADCHLEPVRCQAPPPRSPSEASGRTVGSGKVYPTMHTSPPPEMLKEKALMEVAPTSGPPTLTSLNIPPRPYSSMHKLLETQSTGTCQSSCKISSPCLKADSGACGPDSCPYCVRTGAGEVELAGHEMPDSDSEAVYEFTQDAQHGDRRNPHSWRRRSLGLDVEPNSVLAFWRLICDTFRKIVDSKYFGRGIMIAILVNTLSMGIEYHEQPEELTNALEISNIVFTSLFALEMLLKLLVYGPFGYIKNPYNIFDGVIVVISVWEIVGQQGGGLSVLRTFRLMRVLKLVRFLPALQRQLVVLMKTMDNVATFCMLLMLFIFIFSILGMHLFGCKFASERDGDTLPDRKNFDSLLWAIVTVFQILTQEDWNKVLYNGMASTSSWAALYFIALMTFGNYVLFNLLVAILVEGFQAEGDATKSESEPDFFSPSLDGDGDRRKRLALVSLGDHPELRSSLLPPLIIHTAATPMSLPKSSSTGLAEALGPASRRASSSGSAEPGAPHETKSPPSARSSPHSPWSAASSWASRRSSRNSLGRAPSLKRRSPSGERRSLLSGEGQESQDEEESSEEEHTSPAGSDRRHRGSLEREAKSSFDLPDTLQVPGLHRTASGRSSASEHQDCNGKSAPGRLTRALRPDDPPLDGDDGDDEGNLSKGERMRAWVRARLPACCLERDSWSAYIFPPQSRFRLLCHRIITHKMFDHVVLVIIFLNCITIAMERPKIDPHSAERIFLTLSNYIFTAVFLAEMTVKVVALGWCFGEQAYLRSSWNVLDGLLVLISIIDILVSMVSDSGTKILGMLRVLRLLRTLRPLRVISRAQGLKLVVETLMSSLKPIGNIVVICCAFFIIFGILGVQLFKGKFFVCQGEDTRNITNKSDCAEASYRWVRHKYNFDNLGQALMSLFVLASKDGWVDIMYDGLDAVGVDQQPIMNHNPWMLLYFISFLLIVAFFVLNMFVGVVVENFHKCRQHQEEEEARRREEKRLRRLEKKRRSKEKQMAVCLLSRTSADGTLGRRQPWPCLTSWLPFRGLQPSQVLLRPRLGSNAGRCNCFRQLSQRGARGPVQTLLLGLLPLPAPRPPPVYQPLPGSLHHGCHWAERGHYGHGALPAAPDPGRGSEDLQLRLHCHLRLGVSFQTGGLWLSTVLPGQVEPAGPGHCAAVYHGHHAGGDRGQRLTAHQPHHHPHHEGVAYRPSAKAAEDGCGHAGAAGHSDAGPAPALGVELFGDLECDETHPCEGLGRHATFRNFGMAFLTLFRVSTGDNWNGIMKDTLRDCDQESTCYNTVISPIYFVSFVLTAQFVLVNVVIAVLMKHLEESNKEAKEEAELEAELELEMKTLSPQAPSPLGSPFLWPGVEGPDSPGSPKSRAPHAAAHAETVSHFSLEHPMMESRTEEVPVMLRPDLLTVRKSGVSRTHSLPNDSYMCRDGSTAEGSLGHRGWGLPKAQSGSVLSVHSQPADTSYILQLPKDAPQLLQPHGAPTLGTIPKLPPPGRSPLAQRPLRRQAAIRTDSLDIQGLGSREDLLSEVSGPSPPLAVASSFWGRSSTQAQQHSHSQSKISKHMPPSAPCPGPEPTWSKGPSEIRSSLELDTELSWISGDLLPVGSQAEAPSPRDLKKCYSVEARSCPRRPASWLDEQRRHSIAVSCLDRGSQPRLGPGPSSLRGQPLGGPGSRPKKKLSPPSISIDPPESQSQGPRPPPSPGVCLRRRAPSSDSKDPSASGPPDSMAASLPPKKDVLSLSGLSSDPADLEP
ncbi:voltage-dependent T-type calcium channel subunit alpha-1G isoform X2 [Balaenoptera acutorostrata]|uniref:Voltage-dependent T-type calcium channel subunit alpha n=1 Tax=Balaenoptera acutorostrata TaxID=9767 RepID=A0ABM3SP63_BALAC|nr:voltage-dependent T-type calcium channel subunit alpha-1G isoform X2 [Balaenoptera acutorostrata]